jgi:signal peptidase I
VALVNPRGGRDGRGQMALALTLALLVLPVLSSCGGAKGSQNGSTGATDAAVSPGGNAGGSGGATSTTIDHVHATAATHDGAGASKTPAGDPSGPTVVGDGSGDRPGAKVGTGGGGSNRARSHGRSRSVGSGRHGGRTAGSLGGSAGASGEGSPSQGASTHGETFTVPTTDMEPTYPIEKVVTYDPARTTPARGEVVVFKLPQGALEGSCGNPPQGGSACQIAKPEYSESLEIGRVAALAGESIAFQEGNAVVNGQLQSEPWMKQCENIAVCTFPSPITVPSNSYYIVYDNRGELDDSRVWGALPQAAIVGTVEDS